MTEHHDINKAVELIAKLSVDRASQVFSKLVKCGAKIDLEKVSMEDITEVTSAINAEGGEIVAALIDLVGDAPFKFLLMMSVEDVMPITDLMLQKEIGHTKTLDMYSMSAIQEVGNILASAVTNVFSTDFQVAMKPLPPDVVHDFAGTIFAEYISQVSAKHNEVLIIESLFNVVRHNLKCKMFIMPMEGSEDTLKSISSSI